MEKAAMMRFSCILCWNREVVPTENVQQGKEDGDTDGRELAAGSVLLENMEIRCAEPQDVDAIASLEAACFPRAEAATREAIAQRVRTYPNHFFLLWDGNRLVSFVNGLVTDQPDLTDEMYENAAMHCEDGAWQMIFGVDTDPARRRQGLAGRVLERFIDAARAEGRQGVVLTCKERLIHYYAAFGFVDEGVSGSTHGNVVWHQMRLTFGC